MHRPVGAPGQEHSNPAADDRETCSAGLVWVIYSLSLSVQVIRPPSTASRRVVTQPNQGRGERCPGPHGNAGSHRVMSGTTRLAPDSRCGTPPSAFRIHLTFRQLGDCLAGQIGVASQSVSVTSWTASGRYSVHMTPEAKASLCQRARPAAHTTPTFTGRYTTADDLNGPCENIDVFLRAIET